MRNHIHHADLVARALNRLDGPARDRVDAAIAADPALQSRLDRISQHLLLYDHLPDAPPAPAFDTLNRLVDSSAPLHDSDSGKSRRVDPRDLPQATRPPWARSGLLIAATAAAALLLLLASNVFDRRDGGEADDDPPVLIEASIGAGVDIVRDGRRLGQVPVGSERALALRVGDRLSSERPAEFTLTGLARVVLDGSAPLRIDSPRQVALREGRAWFEVEPGAFAVDTPYGAVDVLGTAFEVDLTGGSLRVSVVEGTVRVGGRKIEAGSRLSGGGVSSLASQHVGAWFRAPRLVLSHRGEGIVRAGAPLGFDVGFANDGYVSVEAGGSSGLLSPLRVELWRVGDTGERQGDALPLTIHAENVVSGGNLLEPGQPVILVARETRTLSVRLLSPFSEPGSYRLRAWYGDDEGRTPSNLLEIEVRR